MTHLWLRIEHRGDEYRTGLTPEGAARLIAAGFQLTVEDSPARVLPTSEYANAGCRIAHGGSWKDAPADAIVLGLKELPDEDTPLIHRHIFFGHAYKGQPGAGRLLRRFRDGGGALYDLEALTDGAGRRVAAFGYWAGYAGAAVSLRAFAAQAGGGRLTGQDRWPGRAALQAQVRAELAAAGARPRALVVGALGRVGTGAADLCREMGVPVTLWDLDETAHGGPFPEILAHELLFNCILARPGSPVFVPVEALSDPRALSVIGDIACDPGVPYSPIPLYDRPTDWEDPVLRVHDDPPLDIMAIDNLPALLPLESTLDFAEQLLPHLESLTAIEAPGGVWARARAVFDAHVARLG